MRTLILALCAATLAGCGSLEKKASMINIGDTKAQVQASLGAPDDRQLKGDNEAWQYCQTGAGFGYHDYRVVWFKEGKVTGLNSYKSSRPGTSCMYAIKPIQWEDAPHAIVEIRNR